MDWLKDYGLILLIGLALVVVERFWPLHPRQKRTRRSWRIDFTHLFLSGAIIRLAATGAIIVLSMMAFSVVPAPVRNWVRAQPDWLEFVALFVLFDLCYYWIHRLFHTVPALWKYHEVHHSSESLDWLATYRVHPVDQVISSTFISLPTIILGFSPEVVIFHALIFRLHSPFLHSNVNVSLGWLGWIIANPIFHHWHHADVPAAYNRNYAAQLSLYDRIFGTYYAPTSGSAPTRYGVGADPDHGYLDHLIKPFKSPDREAPMGTPEAEASA